MYIYFMKYYIVFKNESGIERLVRWKILVILWVDIVYLIKIICESGLWIVNNSFLEGIMGSEKRGIRSVLEKRVVGRIYF